MIKLKSTTVISFMGVDGSGKSTLIKEIQKKLKSKIEIKYLHLRPYLFLTDKRTVIKNPHNKKKLNLVLISFIRIILWFFIYKIFFYFNLNKSKKLIIFDRYAHDILIDPIRYRINLPKLIIKKILFFFPNPDLWIILKVKPRKAYERKKEISLKETEKQSIQYMEFAKNQKNSIIIDTNNSVNKSTSILLKHLNKFYDKN